MNDRRQRHLDETQPMREAQRQRDIELAWDGDGLGYDFGPRFCPVCNHYSPFMRAHSVLWDGTTQTIDCNATGRSIPYAEYVRRSEEPKAEA